jgi:hypothetical protein
VGIVIPLISSNLRHPRLSAYFIFAKGIIFAEICNPHNPVASAYEDRNNDCRKLFLMYIKL